MSTITTTTTTTNQQKTGRYRMVPLAALERAQGELQTVYQQLAELQQQLNQQEKTPAPEVKPDPEQLCTCGHPRALHTGELGTGDCVYPGSSCNCICFFPKDKAGT